MRTISDSAFAIGYSHAVCEDYALHRWDEHVAILSDGCSSSPDTDWGARLLCRAALQEVQEARQRDKVFQELQAEPDPVPDSLKRFFDLELVDIILKANEWRESLGLPSAVLDATLGLVRVTASQQIEVLLAGDGVVAARRRDGTGLDYWVVDCSLNAPTYLSYLVKQARDGEDLDPMERFQKMGGGIRKVTACSPERLPTVEEDGVWSRLGTDNQQKDDVENLALSWTFSPEGYDVVAVFSDGVESFMRPDGPTFRPVPVEEVLAELMDFKQLTVGFAERRLQRFLRKTCVSRGWKHYDDLSIAAVACVLVDEIKSKGGQP